MLRTYDLLHTDAVRLLPQPPVDVIPRILDASYVRRSLILAPGSTNLTVPPLNIEMANICRAATLSPRPRTSMPQFPPDSFCSRKSIHHETRQLKVTLSESSVTPLAWLLFPGVGKGLDIPKPTGHFVGGSGY